VYRDIVVDLNSNRVLSPRTNNNTKVDNRVRGDIGREEDIDRD
jgi:hypothetical protein